MPVANHEDGLSVKSTNRHWGLIVKTTNFALVTPWFGLFVRNGRTPYMPFPERDAWFCWKRRKPTVEGDTIFVNNYRLVSP